MRILGLDVSTTTTGVAVIDSDTLELIHVGHVDTKKIDGMVAKATAIMEYLEQLECPVDIVAIEEPLVAFQKGASSGQIISKLGQINGAVQYITYHLYDTEPRMLNVSTARKLALPNIKYKKGVKRKITAYEGIMELYPDLPVELKRTGTVKDYCYDRTDAIVIALAQAKRLNNVTPK